MPRKADGRALSRPRSGRDPLARLFDTPHLVRLVPHLSAETLHQLIRYRGLDASGELLAAATRKQLSSLLDLDLWRSAAPASDEQFDIDRFAEWLEALVETGESTAARIVSGIDEGLIAAGLSGYISVFDPATRATPWGTEDEAMQDGSTAFSGASAEVGGYLIRARRTDAWDTLVSLLLALDADHPDYFRAVMSRCRRLSNSRPEDDGLDDLLEEPEQLLHDLAVAREVRRTEQRYLAPAHARAWLQMARQAPLGPPAHASALHSMAAEYLRDIEGAAAVRSNPGEREDAATAVVGADVEESIEAVVDLLAQAGLAHGRPRALLAPPAGQPSRVEQMRALLGHLEDANAQAYVARSRELAFLANALMTGCSVDARPFTIQEAADAAVATCNLGLELWQADRPEAEAPGPVSTVERRVLPASFLADHDLIAVFQLGWAALHEMSMSAAARLARILEKVRTVDMETQLGLEFLRRTLVKQCEAGSPWRARDALDVIAVLDMLAWVSLLGVLGECPVLPAALTATLERRTGAVSATAFEFISTRSQVGQVRAFTSELLDILLSIP